MHKLTHTFLENILNKTVNPIFVKNEDHVWVMVNDAFCAFIGQSKEKIIGKSDYDFFPKEQADVFWEKDKEVFDSGIKNTNEEAITDSQGKLMIIVTSKNIVEDDLGRKFLVGDIHDVTEKRNLINHLEKSNTMLERYAQMVSHDLKSPLKTMKNFAQLMTKTTLQKLDKDEQEYLNFIIYSSQHLSELVDKLLGLSKVNDQRLILEEVDVSKQIEKVYKNIVTSNPTLEFDLNYNDLINVNADRKLVRQLFFNILTNAVKYKAEDRKLVINIESKVVESGIKYCITDNGIGMKEKDLSRIFSMFVKLGKHHSSKGTGIGLATCELIVKHHNGEIWAESTFGIGSTFHFTISNNI